MPVFGTSLQSEQGNNSSSMTVDRVSGITPGDLLLIHVANRVANCNYSDNLAGWSLIFNHSENNQTFGLYARIADGTEPATETVTTSAQSQQLAFYARWSDAGIPDVVGAFNETDAPTTVFTINTLEDGSTALTIACTRDDSASLPFDVTGIGWNNTVIEASISDHFVSQMFTWKDIATAGSTGNASITDGDLGGVLGVQVSIPPAPFTGPVFGNVKISDGASFLPTVTKVWDGLAWITAPIAKVWDGIEWLPGVPPPPPVPLLESFTTEVQPATTTNHPFTKPSGVQVGDFLMLIVSNDSFANSSLWQPLTGWTQEFNFFSTSTDTNQSMYWRIADGTEGATVTVNTATEKQSVGWYTRWTNASSVDVIGSYTNAGATSSITIGSETTIAANTVAIAFWAFDGSDGFPFDPQGNNGWGASVPGGQELQSQATTSGVSSGWIQKDMEVPGPTGDCTIDAAASDGLGGTIFAIKA